MERDDLMRATATRYADAQLKLELADRDASLAKTAAENARLERDRIEKELKEFVGRNIPRKLIAVGNSRAVLIDHRGDENVFVSVESML